MRKTTKQQARKEINSSFQIVNACFIKRPQFLSKTRSLSIFGHRTFFQSHRTLWEKKKKKNLWVVKLWRRRLEWRWKLGTMVLLWSPFLILLLTLWPVQVKLDTWIIIHHDSIRKLLSFELIFIYLLVDVYSYFWAEGEVSRRESEEWC